MAFFAARPHPPLPTKDLISWLFDDCPYDANQPVYIDLADTSRTISFNQARSTIRKLIAGLRRLGVKPGECVLVLSFNDIYYPILGLAIIGAGAIFSGANPAYTKLELVHHIKITEAKWLFAETDLLPTLIEAAEEVNTGSDSKSVNQPIIELDWRSIGSGPGSGSRLGGRLGSLESLMDHGEQDWVRFDDLETCKTRTAVHATSSGTTGLPKATMITHYNFISQHELVWAQTLKNRPFKSRFIFPMPMFHLAIQPVAFTTGWRVGRPCYVMQRFDLEKYVAAVDKWKITDLMLVPPIMVSIVMSPLVKGSDSSQGRGKYSLQSVRSANVGAAPLSKETQLRFKRLLSTNPKATVTQVWGMTETTCIVTSFDYPEDDDTGSVGYLRPGIEAKIVDDDGRDISAYNVAGEICVRGPTIIPGYLNNDKANRETFDQDGFCHSGDIGYVDEKTGKWYLIDRKKEFIKVRGFQVAPPELEGVLLQHPGIVDAAVIGVKESTGLREGEVPLAFVVRRPGSSGGPTEEEVQKWVSDRLSSYKRLDGGVRFVDAIPKNASGKILKRVLRDLVKKEQPESAPKL